ncbi:hypothetical protein V6N11_079644 [Hibiscus sabdariffa]|uniref:Disease resistance protein At4g27190-like leucine-rich repeats domain-containing protein n=1 Tax=Hibiscus sabdariffa TaxID=183260 RepID=A0ABR2RW95_9ROSI
MKVVSCVRGELLSIVGLYGRISQGPERRWFTLWRMSAVRFRLSPTRELSRNKGEAVKCRTLDGDSPVAESITSLRSDPSSMGHVESRVNQQGPPCKAKYTSMQFSSLPSSICLLTSLSTLSVDRCKLGADITIIGGLKSLEILSLLKSDIRILPKEIGQLVKLKLLDVSGCAKLKTISSGVLSCFTRLEEIYMGGNSIQWGQSSTASLAELNTLSRLSTLEVQIQEAKAAPRNFFEGLQKLERYKIFIGDEWEWERECKCFGNYQYSRIINLGLSTSIEDLDRGIKKLLKKTEDLHLDELKGVKIALQELTDEQSLSRLKNLHIQNGLDTEYITNDGIEFPQLQFLTLQNLPQLLSFCPQHEASVPSSLPQQELPLFSEKISFPCLEKLWLKSINVTRVWHHQLSTASFRTYDKLTTLKIEGCGSLKHLLSFSMAKCLMHLTDFEIIGCHCLREIVFMEEIEEETQATMTLFPQLKSFKAKGSSASDWILLSLPNSSY